MSKLVSGPVERNRCLKSKHRCCSPDVHFLPMGYRGNAGDGASVTSILSIITPVAGPCFFFPLLYKTEVKFLDLTLRDLIYFILCTPLHLVS